MNSDPTPVLKSHPTSSRYSSNHLMDYSCLKALLHLAIKVSQMIRFLSILLELTISTAISVPYLIKNNLFRCFRKKCAVKSYKRSINLCLNMISIPFKRLQSWYLKRASKALGQLTMVARWKVQLKNFKAFTTCLKMESFLNFFGLSLQTKPYKSLKAKESNIHLLLQRLRYS